MFGKTHYAIDKLQEIRDLTKCLFLAAKNPYSLDVNDHLVTLYNVIDENQKYLNDILQSICND